MTDETNALLRDIVLLNFLIAALLFIAVSYFAGSIYRKHRRERTEKNLYDRNRAARKAERNEY